MAYNFNTIHIFGYGEVQLIAAEKSGKVKSTELGDLIVADFVKFIKEFKPENIQESDFHVIHIFNGGDVKYLGKSEEFTPKVKKSFSFSPSSLDEESQNKYNEAFAAFYQELVKALAPAQPA